LNIKKAKSYEIKNKFLNTTRSNIFWNSIVTLDFTKKVDMTEVVAYSVSLAKPFPDFGQSKKNIEDLFSNYNFTFDGC
jgi:hypothetical protein